MTTSNRSTFSSYRAEVARRARLTRHVEQELAVQYRNGDRAAARRLIEGCLVTVIIIAHGYRRCGLLIEDLVQEGNLGLLKALEHFDPARGVRLCTYATPWIRVEPVTLEQLGATWGVTRERVRQLEERVKTRMRARLLQIGAHGAPPRDKADPEAPSINRSRPGALRFVSGGGRRSEGKNAERAIGDR